MERRRTPKPERPFILVNAAMTLDGKLDAVTRRGAVISSPQDKERVDRLRASVDAVMVGGKTLLAEDPRLTVRSPEWRQERLDAGKPENPLKVGVVSCLKAGDLPAESRFLGEGDGGVMLFTTTRSDPAEVERLRAGGVTIQVCGDERVDLLKALSILKRVNVHSLLVEGGGTLLAEFFRLGVVDELTLYLTPRIFGGGTAPTLADGDGFLPEKAPCFKLAAIEKVDDIGGVLLRYQAASRSEPWD